jgi:hypothetical protein
MPAPLTSVHVQFGAVEWHSPHTAAGGWVNLEHAWHWASTSRCSAAAAQKGADTSSGAGTGRVGLVTG